jgi:hypothetical protein
MTEARPLEESKTFEQREAMALRDLEIARSWSRKNPRRPRSGDVEVDPLPDREAYERHVDADEIMELGLGLLEWADELEIRDRKREAFVFVQAAIDLGWNDFDEEVLVRLHRLASETGHAEVAERARRRLAKRGREVAAVAVAPQFSGEAQADLRYRHPRFGVGVLVARERDGLRVRFEDQERVILEETLERLDP